MSFENQPRLPEDIFAGAVNLINVYAQQPAPADKGEQRLQRMCNTVLSGTPILAFATRIKGMFQLESNVATIDDLSRRIGSCTTVEGLTQCVDYHEKNLSCIDMFKEAWKTSRFNSTCQIKEQLEALHAADLQEFQHIYQADLLRVKVEMANSSMYWAVANSFVVVLSQSIQLLIIWKDIEHATNLLDDRAEKALMKALLDRLLTELTSLENFVENWKEMENGRKKEKEFLKIQRDLNKVRALQQDTFSAIDNMKFKIDGQISKLGDHRTTLAMNGVSNAAHFTLTAAQLVSSSNLLGMTATTLSWVAISLLGVVQAANIGTYIVTGKKIAQLREALQQYKLLDLELTELTCRITQIADWADEQNFDDM